MTERPPFLSIIVPAYNEERRLPDALERIGAYLAEKGLDAELIVVDDGSRDGTARIVEEARLPGLSAAGRLRLIRNRGNRGKGHSVRRGVLDARGIWVLFTDSDLSTPIEDFEKLYKRATAGGHDIVIGSRGLPDSNIELYQPFHRVFMGQTFNRIVRLMTGLPFRDTQCGFKLMARERVRSLFERMVVDRFAFDVELLFLAHRAGLSVAEEPITWRDSPRSKVGLLGDPLNMLRDVWKIRRRFARGLYRPPGGTHSAPK